MTQDIRLSLRALFGPAIGVGATDPRQPSTPLWREERSAVARAVPKRVQEFAAGRAAARAALSELGHPPAAIPMGQDRAPLWPSGLVGSIAHCETLCIAVASQAHRGIGIDVEPDTPLDHDLWDIVCTRSERRWVDAHPTPGQAAKQIFCAKEAVYKAQYLITGQMLTFHDVTLTPLPTKPMETQRFSADIRSFPQEIACVRVADGLILAGCGYALSNKQATSSTNRASRT